MVRPHALIGLPPTRPSLSLGLRAWAVRGPALQRCTRYRNFYTLGIETSCDDTCVAIIKSDGNKATPVYYRRIPCPNKKYEGIHPLEAVESHTRLLPGLIQEALRRMGPSYGNRYVPRPEAVGVKMTSRQDVPAHLFRPDLIAVTRGPGMKACLSIGISAAKALSMALRVPLIGVHHMQAHALTPQMESAFLRGDGEAAASGPQYPFITLLVSGGHTMLLHTKSSLDHRIVASTSRGTINPQEKASPIAIGDMLDKCARVILPDVWAENCTSESIVYAKHLETYVLKTAAYGARLDSEYKAPAKREDEIQTYNSPAGWSIPPPLRLSREMKYDFSGLGGMVRSIMQDKPDMPSDERVELGFQTMRLAFEHLGSRVILALQNDAELLANPPKHLVLSGGVASNMFLRKVLQEMLKVRGFGDIQVTAPSTKWCTDNAAMIAWTGIEMYKAGWTTDSEFLPKGEWPIERITTDTDCWIKSDPPPLFGSETTTNGQQTTPGAQEPPNVKAAEAPPAPSKPAAARPNAASDVPDAENPNKDQPLTDQASTDPQGKPKTLSRRARKNKRALPAAKASYEERLQDIEKRVHRAQQLSRLQTHFQRFAEERARKDEGPPPPRGPRPRRLPKDPKPSDLSKKPPPPTESQAQEGSVQSELIEAERQLGGAWARKTPPDITNHASQESVPRDQAPPASTAQHPPPEQRSAVGSGEGAGKSGEGGGGGEKNLVRRVSRLQPEAGGSEKSADRGSRHNRHERTRPSWDSADKGGEAGGGGEKKDIGRRASPVQRSAVGSEKSAGRGSRHNKGDNRVERTRAPWKGADNGGEVEEVKKHIVRPLRPLQPLFEEAAKPAEEVGALRKRYDALKKWAGF